MSNEIAKRRKRTIEMTQGSLWKNMFFFSVPLIFSQILEVMFNLSDVAVVGHFADYKALGSVGSTTTLVTLFTGLLIGLGSGVNVQVANKLGAGDKKATKETIHSALIICAAAGIFCLSDLSAFCRTNAFHDEYKARTARSGCSLHESFCTWHACHGSL
jgi:Na+-driven multidrug efflux pump